ncbi:AmmeMemoRadiSam system protein B [Candidatus Methylocalor cossyra]|uniref:MEMO1 family protein MECH1_V1_2760 n=1 Tax=Candidatus Methylocalor cossyra TaxID=3108543 RepID=A0ABM9NLL0_9GAMM
MLINRSCERGFTMSHVRHPAVAGLFYPRDGDELKGQVQGFLSRAADGGGIPRAVIAPHAGYVYSGPVAASAYAPLRGAAGAIGRVILMGPSHRLGFRGIATTGAAHYATPLGPVPIDHGALEKIRELPWVGWLEPAHAQEHSLEVQLPFLQTVLGEFQLVPLVAGEASPEQVGEVLARLGDAPGTLIVVSSDLSHYHDYATAQRLDRATSAAIENLCPEGIDHRSACGSVPVNGLLHLARRWGWSARTLDLRNSGDTAGGKDRVVGYGAYAFH